MWKQTQKPKQTQNRKQKPADSLLKTSKKNNVELTEEELKNASGGLLVRKAGRQQNDY